LRKFTDAKNEEWSIAIDAPRIRHVREQTCDVPRCKHRPLLNKDCQAVDLANFDGTTFKLLEFDLVLLYDVLLLLCEEQIKERGITAVEFAERLAGDAIQRGAKALKEAYLDFLPPEQRQFLVKVIERQTNLRELAIKLSLERIDDPEVQAKAVAALEESLDQVIQDGLTRLSSRTSTPDSAASAPTG
jgi:hypothetical protein